MIVVDTGVLLGAADASDNDHDRCAQLLREHRGELQVPAPVVPETAWQIERKLGPSAEAGFIGLIVSSRLAVVDLTLENYRRCAELIERYADLRLGLVDASVITIAERLSITTIATLNRRDFSVVRPRHTKAFELIP
jgi:uncharacterized protein